MKTLIASVLLLIGVSLEAAPTSTWGLWWDQPTNMPVLASYVPGTNQAYQVYVTQNLGTPLTNWTLTTTWTNWTVITNGNGTISLSNNITLPFGQAFFAINPTNVFGAAPLLSGYCGLAWTGPPWSSVNNSALNRQGP